MYYYSESYSLIFRFKTHHHIQVDKKGNTINTQTGRKKKLCLNGGSIGMWLDSKTFIVKSKLNNHLERIPKQECPF